MASATSTNKTRTLIILRNARIERNSGLLARGEMASVGNVEIDECGIHCGDLEDTSGVGLSEEQCSSVWQPGLSKLVLARLKSDRRQVQHGVAGSVEAVHEGGRIFIMPHSYSMRVTACILLAHNPIVTLTPAFLVKAAMFRALHRLVDQSPLVGSRVVGLEAV